MLSIADIAQLPELYKQGKAPPSLNCDSPIFAHTYRAYLEYMGTRKLPESAWTDDMAYGLGQDYRAFVDNFKDHELPQRLKTASQVVAGYYFVEAHKHGENPHALPEFESIARKVFDKLDQPLCGYQPEGEADAKEFFFNAKEYIAITSLGIFEFEPFAPPPARRTQRLIPMRNRMYDARAMLAAKEETYKNPPPQSRPKRGKIVAFTPKPRAESRAP